MKKIGIGIFAIVLSSLLYFSFAKSKTNQHSGGFIVASYNVENLFDMNEDGTEYDIYIPYRHSWTKEIYEKKLSNSAKVLNDLKADIVGLQEIESEKALKDLMKKTDYKDYAISKKKSTVKVAILSKFSIKDSEDIVVKGQERAILKVTIDINGNDLIIFVNHWKAKSGGESKRVEYAKAIANEVNNLPKDSDYIILGDLNANYNEFETFRNDNKLNDTGGITGINHILKTTKDNKIVQQKEVVNNCEYKYNLWLEVDDRWSEGIASHKNTLDNIIIPCGMFDNRGISYIDDSFKRFTPDYLVKNGSAVRWKISKKGKGEHLGEGYSDHLPIYATFTTNGFKESKVVEPTKTEYANISSLYSKSGAVDIDIKNATVIFKNGNDAIIKGDRAIYLYNCAKELELGGVYNLKINFVKDFNKLKEVTAISNINKISQNSSYSSLFLDGSDLDLSLPKYQNEIVTNIIGEYKQGSLYYNGKKIKLFFKDDIKLHKTKIKIIKGHISNYYGIQIVIYNKNDIAEIVE
jgi:hypothetical protein